MVPYPLAKNFRTPMNIVASNVLVRKAIMYVWIRLLQFGSSMLGEIGHFLDKVVIIIMTKEL